MISYTYRFNKDVKSETKEYSPNYPTQFFNIAKLTGPNSSGKSTLMNLIAIAFHGLESKNLSPDLKTKIELLYKSPRIDLDFSITISNEKGRTLKSTIKTLDLSREVAERKITIEESINKGEPFKTLTKESFLKKYSVIYDIPNQPLSRINDILVQMNNEQNEYESKLQKLLTNIREKQAEIKNAKNPAEIEKVESMINQLNNSQETFSCQYKANENILTKLEKRYHAKAISEAQAKHNELSKKSQETGKRVKAENKANKELQRQYETAVNNVLLSCNVLNNSYKNSVAKLGEIAEFNILDPLQIDSWKNYSIEAENITQLSKLPLFFVEKAIAIKNALADYMKDKGSYKELKQFDAIKALYNVLEFYSNEKIEILGGPIKQLFQQVEEEYKLAIDRNDRSSKVKSAHSAIEEVINNASTVTKNLKLVPIKPDNFSLSIEDNYTELVKSAKRDLDNCITESARHGVSIDNYQEILNNDSPEISAFLQQDLESLKKSIEYLTVQNTEIKNKLDGPSEINAKLMYLKEKLKDLNNTEEHRLQAYSKELDILSNTIGLMIKDLQPKIKILKDLAEKKKPKIIDDTYMELVSESLGKRFETIRHEGKVHSVQKVDVIDEKIITSEGEEIEFYEFGTGESQNAYLKWLLNNNTDKCLIAMFDESEHMDSNNEKNVQDKFYELYQSGQLLVGLMAAPGDNPNVENYNHAN